MFIELCGGEIKTCIPHPCAADEKLWLLFDSTHNMKNIYNNWLNKGTFRFSSSICSSVTEACVEMQPYLPCEDALFSNVKQVYMNEETKPLKTACKLTRTALLPNNIQRTSPKHCLGKLSIM